MAKLAEVKSWAVPTGSMPTTTYILKGTYSKAKLAKLIHKLHGRFRNSEVGFQFKNHIYYSTFTARVLDRYVHILHSPHI